MRVLVAGFGNALRGDDGFGVEVLRRLRDGGLEDEGIELLDVGTGGIRLAQELLAGYDRLVIIDAMHGGGAPGAVYVREVESVQQIEQIDLHLAVPAAALAVANALGALPPEVFIVGCEPEQVDELTTELSPAVRAAVDPVVAQVRALMGETPRQTTEEAGA